MNDRDVRILGVKHTENRIHEGVNEEADQITGPDVVYHEWPSSDHDWRAYLKWIILKNPSVIAPSLLYFLFSALKMRRGLSINSSGTVLLKSECKIAAERIRDEYDATLVNVGKNRIELLKERSWLSAAQSWAITILTLWIIFSAFSRTSFGLLWFLLFPLALSLAHRKRTLDKVRSDRDEHMATAILNDFSKRHSENVLIIVGQKHIEGIATVLGSEGISPVCRWLANEAEAKDTS